MGLMLSCDALGLPKSLPVAWASEESDFQTWEVIHLGIRTGFCGSLTTYSSWNSEMVVLMFSGEGSGLSLIFRALLGYLIGVQTALASFEVGKIIARGLHRIVNPKLHVEFKEIMKKKTYGVYINRDLPDFERRFLPDLNMYEHEQYLAPGAVEPLFRWRESTKKNRFVGNELIQLLIDIEIEVLVAGEELEQSLRVAAQNEGWDIEALEDWMIEKKTHNIIDKPILPRQFKFMPSLIVFMVIMGFLLFKLFSLVEEEAYTVTYRTMVYVGIFAPFGALLRWKLSKYNNRPSGDLSWIPIGTLSANFVASAISGLMIGMEYQMDVAAGFWAEGTVRAIKVGFCGSLSTVSTFVSEIDSLLKSSIPTNAYLYIFLSLSLSCVFASIIYGSMVSMTEE